MCHCITVSCEYALAVVSSDSSSLRRHCGFASPLQKGQTALICAAKSGHIECVRLLLDAGADAQASIRGEGIMAPTMANIQTASQFSTHSARNSGRISAIQIIVQNSVSTPFVSSTIASFVNELRSGLGCVVDCCFQCPRALFRLGCPVSALAVMRVPIFRFASLIFVGRLLITFCVCYVAFISNSYSHLPLH